MKTCNRCGVMKHLADFSPDRRLRDGVQGMCRQCRAAGELARWRRDPESARRRTRAQYHKHRAKRLAKHAAWQRENKDRLSDYRRERWHANPTARDKQKVATAAWYRRHPEKVAAKNRNRYARVRAGGGSVTAEEWAAMLSAYSGKCAYCGTAADRIDLDHMVPLSRGGVHVIENVIPACLRCNSSKGARTPLEWFVAA